MTSNKANFSCMEGEIEKDGTRGGVSKGPFDSRCDQTKQALTNKLADREKRLRSKELQMQRVLEAQPFIGSKVKHLFEI